MKKYIIILIAGLLMTTTSCNDWLDLKPSTKVVNDGSGITTLSEAGYRLNALYSMLRNYYLYGARMTYYGDACGEDMQSQSGTKRVANYYTFRFTADNAPGTYWTSYYEVINNVNILINGIDGLTNLSAADEIIRKDYKGQALTIRALAYFDLTRLYGYPYLKDNGASLAVPIVIEAVKPDYKPKRNTVAACYDLVINDLTAALPLMKITKNNGRFNQWAAMSLLSRVYLYKGDDVNALKTAKDAITGAEANGYKLWTAAEYSTKSQSWAMEFGSECLWEIPVTSTEYGETANELMGYLTAADGYDDIFISNDWLVNLMGSRTADIRYNCVITDAGKGSKSGTRYMWKYPVNSGETAKNLGNIKVLRLSETYLIAAEAAARSNNNDDAIKYLDPIVKRGDATKTVTGTTVTLDRVLEERRIELVGEGHRFFDAIRNGKRITRTTTEAAIGTTVKVSHLPLIVPEAWDFDWTYYKVVLPIPKSEMDANPTIRDQQNPGY